MDIETMLATHCAVCGRADGEPAGGGRAMLREVELLSKFMVDRGTDTAIVLCSHCLANVPFDISALMKECNWAVERSVANNTLLKGLVERYIRDVWPDDEPPSYVHLCELVNAVGLRPPAARVWTYHNLKQKLDALGVDRQACLTQRAAATYADRLDALTSMSSAWLNSHLSRDFVPPSAVGVEIEHMPGDMPGVETDNTRGGWPADRIDGQV